MIGEPGLRALSQRLFRNSAPVKPRMLGWETPSLNPKCSTPPPPPSGGGKVWPNCPGVVLPSRCRTSSNSRPYCFTRSSSSFIRWRSLSSSSAAMVTSASTGSWSGPPTTQALGSLFCTSPTSAAGTSQFPCSSLPPLSGPRQYASKATSSAASSGCSVTSPQEVRPTPIHSCLTRRSCRSRRAPNCFRKSRYSRL